MNNKVFISAVLFFASLGICNAQTASKASAKSQKQTYVYQPRPSDLLFLEKNKELLSDFDEAALLKQANKLGYNASEIVEFTIGKKIKHINKKLNVSPIKTAARTNSTLTSCDNIGFDQLDFTNWTGFTGEVATGPWDPCPNPFSSYFPGFVLGAVNEQVRGACGAWQTNRHTILTDSTRYDTLARDPITGDYLIRYISPGGGNSSVRLGNPSTGGETERLRYQIDVDSTNTQYTYRYAVVYQSPSSHDPEERPFFQATVTDSLGIPVGGSCGAFCFQADPTDPSFILLPGGNQFNDCFTSEDILIKPWTTVAFDLTPYIGQTVFVEFTTGDCALSGHFGYAYVDGVCGINQTTVSICPNSDTALLIAPVGYQNYQWFDSNNVLIPNNTVTGDTLIVLNPALGMQFSVTLESSSGGLCVSQFNIAFLEYTQVPVSTTVVPLVCNDVLIGSATAIVTSSVVPPPYSYQWFNSTGAIPGANNATYFTTVGDTFWVKVTSTDGCSNFIPDTAIVSAQANYSRTLTADTSNTCLASPVQFNLTITPIDSLFTFAWTPTTFLSDPTAQSPSADILIPGSYSYQVKITGSSGCVRTDSVVFVVKANYPPIATAFGKEELCDAETAQLGIDFGPGTPGICGLGGACSGPSAVSQVGSSTATTNSTTTYPAPFGDYFQNTKQQYIFSAVELLAAGVKPGLINSISFNILNVNASHLSNNYTVKMGCVATTEFDPNNLQFVDTASLFQVFNPKQISLVAGWNALDFDFNYAWDGINNIIIETCTEGNNFPFVDQNCVSPYTTTANYSCIFRRNDAVPSTICSDSLIAPVAQGGVSKNRPNIQFSVCAFPPDTNNVTYTWTPASGLTNAAIRNPVAGPEQTTMYSVVIKNTLTGCEDTSQVLITVLPQAVAFIADPLIGGGPLTVNFTNTSDANLTSYNWSFGDGTLGFDTVLNNTSHIFSNAGEYTVTLIGINSDGCSDTASTTIVVTNLEIPNVFTPNGDNNNDIFHIDLPGLESFSGVIFNRWGKKMFEWTDPADGWDGKSCKDGVYYYVIKAKGIDGQDYNEQGHVSLIR